MDHDSILSVIKSLVEGRIEPQVWLDWWEANSSAVKKQVKPGHFTRMKPRRPPTGYRWTALTLAAGCVDGACRVLDSAGISYESDTDFAERARLEEVKLDEEAMAAVGDGDAKKRETMLCRLERLQSLAPNLCSYLKENKIEFEITPNERGQDSIATLESQLGTTLPPLLSSFLLLVERFSVEGFQLDIRYVFWHPTNGGERYLCIGDYFLNADGDQLLINPKSDKPETICYFDHAHGDNGISIYSKNLVKLLEDLPELYLNCLSG